MIFFKMVVSFLVFSSIVFPVDKYLKQEMQSVKKSKTVLYPSNFLSKEFISSLDSFVTPSNKVKRIKSIVEQVSSSSIVTYEQVNKMLQIIYYIRKHHLDVSDLKSIYLHKELSFFPFSVHMYSSGHTYLLFEDHDPKSTKGGYKVFSRCLDLNNLQLYASLVLPVNDEKRLKKATEELKIMENMISVKHNLSYRDFDSYISTKRDKRIKYLIIQTELYDYDLSQVGSQFTTFRDYLNIFLLAIESVTEFHKKKYVHRDIKLRNFFLRGKGKTLEITLADYGLSQHITDEFFGLKSSGTRGYIAPESCYLKLVNGVAFQDFEAGVRVDTFALGMSLYYLISKEKELSETIKEMNALLFSKKNNKKKPDKIKSYRELLSRLTELYFERAKFEFEKHNRMDACRAALSRLIFDMINPKSQDRINLEEANQRVRDIIAYYEGKKTFLHQEVE